MPFSRRSFLGVSSAAALTRLWPWAEINLGGTDAATQELCRKLAADPLRPQYHLLPAHNWMNDPNGPLFFHGRYHMFHQYNPQGPVWGNMNWAHATSPDMIHWHHEPIAISPTLDGPDRDGVFSGSAVLDHGKPTVIYTAVAPPPSDAEATLRDGVHTWRETQCLAVAQDDDLRVWKKMPDPVIAAPPEGLQVTGFRDPGVWREGDRWMLTLGAGVREKGGMVLLYSSPDLRHWTYLHPLIDGASTGAKAVNPVDTGDMWECPDFFPLGDKHVLLISTMGKVHWKAGSYSKQRFTPEKEGIVDWGAYYAAKTMADRDGKTVLWGWITETRPDAELIAAGWAGAMSLPRVLSLNKDNELQMEVHQTVQQLRSSVTGIRAAQSQSDRQKTLEALRIHDLAAELKFEIRPAAGEFALHLQAEDGKDFVSILCANQSAGRQLRVNNVTAGLNGPADSPLMLHVFVDGSVLEVFAGTGTVLTARIYQAPAGPLRLKIDGPAELVSLDAWQMKPISKDRLTGSLCS